MVEAMIVGVCLVFLGFAVALLNMRSALTNNFETIYGRHLVAMCIVGTGALTFVVGLILYITSVI